MPPEATKSGPTPNKRNTQHGLSVMKRALKEHGTRVIDRRTSLGKALDHWRDELVLDLGGDQAVTTQQYAIINVAVKTKLLLDSIDAWLLQQPSLINLRKRAVHPVVLQRQQLADSLIRAMSHLGLERRYKPALRLTDYLANGEIQKSTTTSASPSDSDAQVSISGELNPEQGSKEAAV